MKLRISTLILLVFNIFTDVCAQTGLEPLSQLKVPNSPAFTILGIQPSEVSRPKTFEALEASLINSFTDDGNIVIPKNFAIEFSPYWMFGNPKLDYAHYVNPNLRDVIKQNFSISIATIDKTARIDTSLKYRSMGLGFRTMLIEGVNSNVEKRALMNYSNTTVNTTDINTYLTNALAASGATTPSDFLNYLKKNYKGGLREHEQNKINLNIINKKNNNSHKLITDFEDVVLPYLENQVTTNSIALNNMVTNATVNLTNYGATALAQIPANNQLALSNLDKCGHMLEFAFATVLDFPTNNIDYSIMRKAGSWLTYTYRTDSKLMDFNLMSRYIWNGLPDQSSNNFDLGIKFTYQKLKLAVSGEFIGRLQTKFIGLNEEPDGSTSTNVNIKQDMKATLSINYQITDKIILNYSFGQNFDLNTELRGNLLNQLGLNFGFGNPKSSVF
jgi:hypothetical protein